MYHLRCIYTAVITGRYVGVTCQDLAPVQPAPSEVSTRSLLQAEVPAEPHQATVWPGCVHAFLMSLHNLQEYHAVLNCATGANKPPAPCSPASEI